MFDFSEKNMDENLEKEIKEKLAKNNDDDLEMVLENYKGLNFIHVWSKNEKSNTYEFYKATLHLNGGANHFTFYCKDDEEEKYDIKINQIWELSQEMINHPYEDRKLDKIEMQKIYKSLEKDFIDYA